MRLVLRRVQIIVTDGLFGRVTPRWTRFDEILASYAFFIQIRHRIANRSGRRFRFARERRRRLQRSILGAEFCHRYDFWHVRARGANMVVQLLSKRQGDCVRERVEVLDGYVCVVVRRYGRGLGVRKRRFPISQHGRWNWSMYQWFIVRF